MKGLPLLPKLEFAGAVLERGLKWRNGSEPARRQFSLAKACLRNLTRNPVRISAISKSHPSKTHLLCNGPVFELVIHAVRLPNENG